MRIAYTMPFRARLDLDKETMLSRHGAWRDLVYQAARDAAGAKHVRLGNYGWAGGGDLTKTDTLDAPQVTHGEERIEDPTWFFRDYFTLRIQGDLEASDLPSFKRDPEFSRLFQHGERFEWECHLIDNTVAVLVLSAHVAFERFLALIDARAERARPEPFVDYGTAWASKTLNASGEISRWVSWVNERLAKPIEKLAGPAGRSEGSQLFLNSEPPMYPMSRNSNHFQPMWAHTIFAFSKQEREGLHRSRDAILRLFKSKDQAAAWLDGGKNAYGWGASAVLDCSSSDRQWLDGACISQFFYGCFDIVDTELTFEIAAQKKHSQQRRFRHVIDSSREVKHATNRVRTDYDDLRVRSSGEGHEALESYYETWRMQPLIEGLEAKLEWLEELMGHAAEQVSEVNQTRIQHILTFITLVSLIGLIAIVHENLASGHDPSSPDFLSGLALRASQVTVVLTSSAVAIVAFIAYLRMVKKR